MGGSSRDRSREVQVLGRSRELVQIQRLSSKEFKVQEKF